MWPFRRARSGNSAAQAVHTPSARREWASVDPMPLAVPPMTGTFGTAAFEAGLRSRQAPTFLEPLGHDLSPTAPAGLVSGLATPSAPSPSTTTVSRQTFDAPPWRARLGEPGPTDPVLAIPTAAPTIARLAEEAPGALTRATSPSGLPTLQLSTVAPHETLNLAPVESTPQLAPTVATVTTVISRMDMIAPSTTTPATLKTARSSLSVVTASSSVAGATPRWRAGSAWRMKRNWSATD